MNHNSKRALKENRISFREHSSISWDLLPNRLQERLLAERSFENFDDIEILATVLSGSGDQQRAGMIAEHLLDTFGSLKAVLEARPEQLMAVKGIDRQRASLITMAIPLARAWIRETTKDRTRLRCPGDAEQYCRSLLIGERLEKFYVVALSVKCHVLGERCISTGTLSEVNTYPRLIVETALNYNAASVLLCHNHPGGTLKPSPEDISNTFKTEMILEALDIHVLDHIIVAGNESYSMRWHGDFCKKKEEQRSGNPERKKPAASPREKNKACYRNDKKEESKCPITGKASGSSSASFASKED